MEEVANSASLASATVVVCAYSEVRWDGLCAAIASIEGQTYSRRESLLVIDHNPGLFARSLQAFPNIKVIENSQGKGLAGARNSGVSRAAGQVVVFLDDDAWAEPDWLRELLGPYADSNVIGTGGLVVPACGRRPPKWFPEEFYWVIGCSYRGLPEAAAPVRNPIAASMSFRRSVFEEVGLFSESLGRISNLPLGCEETELAIRAVRQFEGAKIVHVPTAVVHHVVDSERLSGRYFLQRCFGEGVSKSILTRRVGWRDGLSAERVFTRKIVPRSIGEGLAHAGQRKGRPLRASLMVLVGMATTSLGYGVGVMGIGEKATKMLSGTYHKGRHRTGAEAGRQERTGSRQPDAQVNRASRAAGPTVGTVESDFVREAAASVIICSHRLDRWDWLCAAVRSVGRQTVPVRETVVVIDGDRDMAERAVQELSDTCTVLTRDVCGGLSEARNCGLAAATSPFVAFLDDDAEAEEQWLQQLLEPLADPSVLGVGGRSVPLWEHASPAWFPPELLWVVGCSYAGLPLQLARVRNVFGGCAVYRREAFDLCGGFRSEFGRHEGDAAGCEETEFCLRVSRQDASRSFVYQPSAIIHHHVPASRATVSYVARRSLAEGRSKARLVAGARIVDARHSLGTEIMYARRAFTQAFFADLRSAIHGDSSALAQSAVLALSMVATAYGFVTGIAMAAASESPSTGLTKTRAAFVPKS